MGRIAIAVLTVVLVLPRAMAQPAGGDIEMEPQDAEGSGSGSGSDAAPADAAPADAPPAVPKDPKLAKKLQQAGDKLDRKGDQLHKRNKLDDATAQWEQALVAYTKAIEVADDAQIMPLRYELGLVYAKLGKLDIAAGHLRAVAAAKDGVKADIVKKAQAKYDELTTKIGLVTVTVNAESATISLNGAEIAKTPLAEPLIFMPGTYTLSFSADGFQPKDSEIKVEEGSESERAIELEPIKIVVTPIKVEPEEPVKVEPVVQPSKLPLYIGGGVAIAFAGTAIVTGILAVGQHKTFVAEDTKDLDRDDAQSNGKTLAHVTDVLFVGALAAGGFTAYWYFKKYKPAKTKQTETGNPPPRDPKAPDISKVDVVPWVQGASAGLSVLGSF